MVARPYPEQQLLPIWKQPSTMHKVHQAQIPELASGVAPLERLKLVSSDSDSSHGRSAVKLPVTLARAGVSKDTG